MSDYRTPFIPPQAATLLRAGRKIEAIKLVLDANPGLGLREAKDMVDRYERRPAEATHAPPMPADTEATPDGFPAQAVLALRRGDKIKAIKLLLDANPGLGLREAKDRVERYEHRPAEATHARPMPAGAEATPDGFPAQAERALRSGNKIEAVKIVRALYKLDLHEALARVDAHLQGQAADAPASAGRIELPADVTTALMRGDRVGALELLEKTHGLANADAIQRVLQYERQRSKRGLSGRVDGTVRRGDSNAGMLWWALLIAGAAAMVWYLW
jgi:ribosomal protein L7/L12